MLIRFVIHCVVKLKSKFLLLELESTHNLCIIFIKVNHMSRTSSTQTRVWTKNLFKRGEGSISRRVRGPAYEKQRLSSYLLYNTLVFLSAPRESHLSKSTTIFSVLSADSLWKIHFHTTSALVMHFFGQCIDYRFTVLMIFSEFQT